MYSVDLHEPYSGERVSECFERHKWLMANVGKRNYQVVKHANANNRITRLEFIFQDRDQAMYFKLRWA